jgi:lipoprotein-releasing system permease protein
LNFEYLFARRVTFKTQRKATSLTVRLAILSIALAVATMEIALSFVQGFETEIQNKVVGFGSHIQIGHYYRDIDRHVSPLSREEASIEELRALPGVVAVNSYVQYTAALKSEIGWDGVQLKGVEAEYDWSFFRQTIREGRLPDYAQRIDKPVYEVLISRKQGRRLALEVGDRALLLFIDENENVRRRPATVVGLYKTGMQEFDNNVVICDIRMLQDIWGWDRDEVSGFEVNLSSLELLEKRTQDIRELIPYRFGAEPITNLYPEIFDWLRLQHQNVWVILILMIVVAVVNMTTVVLILIIERTRMVGILKALGLNNFRVRRMFLWNAFFLILLGVAIGNVLGLGLLASQDWLGWLQVNQEDYGIDVVPVAWVWSRFLLVNLGTILACTAFMLIPTLIITRITPIQAIRFD